MRILITGGAGFIGSNLTRFLVTTEPNHQVLVVDKLTYAGNLESLQGLENYANYQFCKTDICQQQEIEKIVYDFQPDAIMHLAAESHVDRSIDGPADFLKTNILGTFHLLEVSRSYLSKYPQKKDTFRFQHISTDEVYGSLGEEGLFTEQTPYDPSSPYSASKASSDHLVRAWHRTYDLPVVLTNCSNNYGPYHFPEKLIPLIIQNALAGKNLPVYGDGRQIRDWLYVEDHVRALYTVLKNGKIGQTYNVGGNSEQENINVVKTICKLLDELCPHSPHIPHEKLITFVADRPGHDRRYAIDSSKLQKELGWKPQENFESGIRKTIHWFLENTQWTQNVLKNKYSGERLGLQK